MITLLGFQPGVPFAFDIRLTVLALVIAIAGCSVGFSLARRRDQMPLGGAIIGATVGAMFYVGTLAIQFQATTTWDPLYVAASLLLGASFGAAALARGHLTPDIRGRLISAVLLTAGIMSVHFVGLAALNLTPDPSIAVAEGTNVAVLFATALTAVVMLIIGLGSIGALIDRYVSEIESRERQLAITADKLSVALEAAEAANETKARFIATMSHELRTPLNAIIGFSDILKKEMVGGLVAKRYSDYAAEISKGGAWMLRMVNDILELSRVDRGELKLYQETIDLDSVIASCIETLEPKAQRKGVRLSPEGGSELPRLYADELRVRQILLHLLSNAIKFTPRDGRVSISTYVGANGLAIVVADTGIGIASEDIPKALERFGQLDNEFRRQYEGAGLGLPLAKHLIELHDGTLEIESVLGAGTKVTITFPTERIVYPDRSAAEEASALFTVDDNARPAAVA